METHPVPEVEEAKKGRTKPKKEIDSLDKIEAEGVEELQEKLKGMKISKKLKKKLLKEEAERQKILAYDPAFHCLKCKEKEGIIINRGDRSCESCFKQGCIHRFKTNLRNSLKIWKDNSNLICVSGGPNSMAMLHLMHVSLFGESQRKMFFKVHIVHIDDGVVYGWDEEKRNTNIQLFKDACEKYKFEYTILSLESVFDVEKLNPNTKEFTPPIEDSKEYVNHHYQSTEENAEKLRELLKYPSELCSSREDLIFNLKKWLLLDFALKFGFKKLLLGCTAVKVTSKVMSEIAKGRGLSLPNDVCFVDDRYLEDIKFMNPMRDYLLNEIQQYNKFNEVSVIERTSISLNNSKKAKKLPGFGSMNLLCEEFINELQVSNVQTVHTVLRTSNKLKLGIVEDESKNYCVLCYGLVDHATNILEVGSHIKSVSLEGELDLMESENDTWNTEFEQHLCFGCKRIMENAVDKERLIDSLPTFIKENAGL
ncbi:unnamed protein product [Moneuplotes crassus]|uniref:Cytoplasmic tRNA 2-thiolation protein 2 n=1 Tax=Euplotes crassus TaxID=5936 RepID=A0AAD1XDY8_EUPCR|nr:unnamed protein product [Moneuplotes crassus]